LYVNLYTTCYCFKKQCNKSCVKYRIEYKNAYILKLVIEDTYIHFDINQANEFHVLERHTLAVLSWDVSLFWTSIYRLIVKAAPGAHDAQTCPLL